MLNLNDNKLRYLSYIIIYYIKLFFFIIRYYRNITIYN